MSQLIERLVYEWTAITLMVFMTKCHFSWISLMKLQMIIDFGPFCLFQMDPLPIRTILVIWSISTIGLSQQYNMHKGKLYFRFRQTFLHGVFVGINKSSFWILSKNLLGFSYKLGNNFLGELWSTSKILCSRLNNWYT